MARPAAHAPMARGFSVLVMDASIAAQTVRDGGASLLIPLSSCLGFLVSEKIAVSVKSLF